MKSLLIHIRPFDFTTMNRVDVRVGSSASAAALGLGGYTWETAVTRRPRLLIDLITEQMDGKVQAGRGDLVINLDTIRLVPRVAQLHWSGAPITIWDADDLLYDTMPVEFTGLVRDVRPDLESAQLTLNLEVSKSKLERPLLGSSFTGGGGLAGDAGKRGVLKPAGFGRVRDVEPVMFDETDNIGMLDGYGNLINCLEIFEGASSLGAPVANYPSYAALKAGIAAGQVPKGRAAVSIADGVLGLGAPPAGVITADCEFGIDRPGVWIRRLLEYHASLPSAEIDLASLIALDEAVDRPVHYWTDQQREVLDLVQTIAGSCNANTLLTFQGKVAIVRPFGGPVVGTIDRFASSVPPVTSWQSAEPEPPTWRVTARADRPGRVLTLDEVFYEDEIEDRGLYRADETYRQGHAVWLQNGSQWLWINPEPGSGRPPPAPPAEQNADWQQIKPPTLASDLTYDDGTPIEDLKPSTPGATRNVPRGPWAPDTDYGIGDVVTYFGSSYVAVIEHLSAAGDPPPGPEWELLAQKGDNAQPLLSQWSVDGLSGWHTNFQPGDQYLRTSNDGGITWSSPAKVVGEGGSNGGTGNTDQFVFRRSATQPATPSGNGIPSGWSDQPPPDNGQKLWMSVAEQTPSGLLVTSWSTPIQLEGAEGGSAFRLANVQNIVVRTPSSVRKVSGAGVAWDAKARTLEGFRAGAAVSADQVLGTFVGLTTDPDNLSGEAYATMDYSLFPSPDGNLYLVRNGAGFSLGGNAPGRLQIWSDNRTIYYSRGGVVLNSHPVNAPNETLYGSFSLVYLDSELTGISFSSAGPAGTDGQSVVAQGSVDGANWHFGLAAGDIYMRISNDGGATFGSAVLIKGEGGGAGGTGNVKQHVFRRAISVPPTPLGNGIPSGWFDGPPAGSDPLWMSVAEQSAAGVLVTSWSTPVRISGEAGQNGLSFDLSTAAIDVQFDATGNPKPGVLPRTIFCSLKAGASDVSGSAVFTVVNLGGNNAAKSSAQVVQITQVTATGFVDIRCQYGAFDQTKRVEVKRTQDQPPVQQGVAVQSTNAMGGFATGAAGAYPANPVYVLLVRSDGAGQLRGYYGAEFFCAPPEVLGTRTARCFGKMVYRVAGSGSAWSDIAAEVFSSPARGRRYEIAPGEQETEQTAGQLAQDVTVTLSPNTDYECGFMVRAGGSDGVGPFSLYGGLTFKQPGA